MTNVRATFSSVIVNVEFTPLLTDWNPIPTRFFHMIQIALPTDFTRNPGDFGVVPGNSLGEVSVWYRILGGRDTITLFSNRLCMEFPEINDQYSELIRQIMQDVEANFVSQFPECTYTALEVIFADHLQKIDENPQSDYLSRYSIGGIAEAFGQMDILYDPSARFSVRSDSGSWVAECFAEKSYRNGNDLFVHMRIRLHDVNEGDHFDEKIQRIFDIRSRCARVLDLELIQ